MMLLFLLSNLFFYFFYFFILSPREMQKKPSQIPHMSVHIWPINRVLILIHYKSLLSWCHFCSTISKCFTPFSIRSSSFLQFPTCCLTPLAAQTCLFDTALWRQPTTPPPTLCPTPGKIMFVFLFVFFSPNINITCNIPGMWCLLYNVK